MTPEKTPKSRSETIIDFIDEACLRDGAVNEWKQEYCEEFLNMTDDLIVLLVKGIIRSDAKGLNKIMSDNSLTDDEKILRVRAHIEGPLQLLFEGRMAFNDERKLCFFKPFGYHPDENMKNRFETWLTQSYPLIFTAFKQSQNASPD